MRIFDSLIFIASGTDELYEYVIFCILPLTHASPDLFILNLASCILHRTLTVLCKMSDDIQQGIPEKIGWCRRSVHGHLSTTTTSLQHFF